MGPFKKAGHVTGALLAYSGGPQQYGGQWTKGRGWATETWPARVGGPASTASIPGGGAGKAQAGLCEVFALADSVRVQKLQ